MLRVQPGRSSLHFLRCIIAAQAPRTACLPAGFLNTFVATFVPAVAGVDLEGLVKQASTLRHAYQAHAVLASF